jgi:hypothetical protein
VTDLKILNEVNGAHDFVREYAQKVQSLEKPVVVIMGIAYGGEVQMVARILKDNGLVYGFDTFEDLHPKHLSKDQESFEATCMDYWYGHKDYGTAELSYEYQRKVLDEEGLTNAILVKGEVKSDSCKDIDYINMAFLDMDIAKSMKDGYLAVKDKMPKGAYLLLHDVYPKNHILTMSKYFYEEVFPSGEWELVLESGKGFMTILKKL